MRRFELAERVIELRERAGLTQGEAAKRAGVGVTTWSNIETGTITRPHARTLIKIARALGTEPEELTTPKAPTDNRSGDERLRDRLAPRIARLEGLGLAELSERRQELMGRLSGLKVYVPYTDETRGVTGVREEITNVPAYLDATDELFAVVLVLERIAGRVEA